MYSNGKIKLRQNLMLKLVIRDIIWPYLYHVQSIICDKLPIPIWSHRLAKKFLSFLITFHRANKYQNKIIIFLSLINV